MTPSELKALRAGWQKHLEAWQQSGLTQIDYCRQHGLKPHQFTYWKARFNPVPVSSKLIPLALPTLPAERSSSVAATLPDGIRLDVPAAQALELLPKLLSAIRSAP